jgi:mRNA-degrading endonuclease toxin of MazEF toxin-antitoxin module
VVCSQVRTIDQTRILGRLGTLPAPIMDAVAAGLRAILDL